MNISLPLPHFESEGLENGNRQHHEDGADETRADGFFVAFVHTVGKGTNKGAENQTIHHIFMQNIPESWRVRRFIITLQHITGREAHTLHIIADNFLGGVDIKN